MKTFSISSARENLSEILGLVRYGDERIQLTHHGHPVAVIIGNDEWLKISGWKRRPPVKRTHKQLPPDHPRHHFPWVNPVDGKIYSCSDRNEHCKGDSGDWRTWLFLGGRGTGKTFTGASWCADMAVEDAGCEMAVIAPTFQVLRERCFEGSSGILEVLRNSDLMHSHGLSYNKNNMKITLGNGSVIQGYSSAEGCKSLQSLRGSNLTYAWLDEPNILKEFTDILLPALRVPRGDGGEPRMVVTATPSSSRLRLVQHLLKQAEKDPRGCHLTRTLTLEASWLGQDAIDSMYAHLTPEEISRELDAEGP